MIATATRRTGNPRHEAMNRTQAGDQPLARHAAALI
jgi:hypothetical protein